MYAPCLVSAVRELLDLFHSITAARSSCRPRAESPLFLEQKFPKADGSESRPVFGLDAIPHLRSVSKNPAVIEAEAILIASSGTFAVAHLRPVFSVTWRHLAFVTEAEGASVVRRGDGVILLRAQLHVMFSVKVRNDHEAGAVQKQNQEPVDRIHGGEHVSVVPDEDRDGNLVDRLEKVLCDEFPVAECRDVVPFCARQRLPKTVQRDDIRIVDLQQRPDARFARDHGPSRWSSHVHGEHLLA